MDWWAIKPHLMKGLEMARTVLMNQVGWAMMRHLRFFLSLQETFRFKVFAFILIIIHSTLTWMFNKFNFSSNKISSTFSTYFYHICSNCSDILSVSLPVNHLVASLQPADAGHLPARSCSVHVNDHVIFCHQQLQAAHNVPEDGTKLFFNLLFIPFNTNNHFKHDLTGISPCNSLQSCPFIN